MLKACTYRKQLLAFCIALSTVIVCKAENPIVTENALEGNLPSEWEISGAGDLSIQGFATDISVNKGQTVRFKIKTDASAYTIRIYRLGYYAGRGARFVANATITASLPQNQPDPIEDTELGLVDCGNWVQSAQWNVPSTAISGIYIARLRRTDNGGASHIPFIVRDDTSTSDILFQASDATWQAYNAYGGNSLYVGTTDYPNGHAVKVSYNRPFVTRAGGGGGGPSEDFLFNAEFPMIRFLERNGYDVTYFTNVDAARNGHLIDNHKVFMSVGHDEYWSAEQRANVEAARAAGTHLAFFSGNEIYWKTRWENSTDASHTAYRTLVCYKEGTTGELNCDGECDPAGAWTGQWRSGCDLADDACNPENALSGQASWIGSTGAIKVPARYKDLRFWRHTSIPSLTGENEATLPMGTLGYEWDFEQMPDYYPAGRITMSSTDLNAKTHKLSLYRHSSGALVFGAGTVQWSWGLDSVHDRGNLPESKDMQQATINILADMETFPATLVAGLTAATTSTDFTAPTAAITSHAQGATIVSGNTVTISGTSADLGGGTLAGVEISLDGGLTWKVAQGTTNWSYSWTPTTFGATTIKVRGFDDSGNIGIASETPSSNSVNVTVGHATCPCSIFQPTDVPAQLNVYDNIPGANLGLKFKSAVNGYITGIRFYKSTNDIGTHTASIWTLGGSLLAQTVFQNETASGWQQVMLPSPIQVVAGITYVVSYHSPTGYYAQSINDLASPRVHSPLTAIAETDPDGPNGVFDYGASPIFPQSGWMATNYFVDVVFDTQIPPDFTAPTFTSSVPIGHATQVNVNSDIQANFSEFIDPASVTTTTFELRDASNNLVPATVSGVQNHAILNPTGSLNNSAVYTARLAGGPGGITDLAGNPLASDITWTFTTSDPAPLPPGQGPGGPILVINSASNPFSTYTAEILRAEGMNEFAVADISTVNASMLNSYDVVVVGEVVVTAPQATMLNNWVQDGGTLIAFKPSVELSSLLGITKQPGSQAEGYILVNTTADTPGAGITGETMQYHGAADLYTMEPGTGAIATLYSNATTATSYPAVTWRSVGQNGGKAIAFTYDLNRSIVYTRQGNPAWAGTKRDGQLGPIRSDDMFFGGTEPDWVDFNKIAIPQADEQQRLLVNLIITGNLHRKPMPRFWFLPSKHKAAMVMTGDDHNLNGTVPLFNHFTTLGPNSPQDVADWKAIRGTSYVYNTTLTNAQAVDLESLGFEIALHVNTACSDFTPTQFNDILESQLNGFQQLLPGVPTPVTNRNHCIAWSDWATVAKLSAAKGIRLDANYYYWPNTFVQNRSGMFTGSGMPMRFADLDGTLIDCYQLTTQMPDESEIDYTPFTNALLDKAVGPEGYYGVFCANMHTDSAVHTGAERIIASSLAHNVPVISARQMLHWLDGRNGSSFSALNMTGDVLTFTITKMSSARNLYAMVPTSSDSGQIISITRNGNIIPFTREVIKGIEYAFYEANTGDYVVTYGEPTTGSLVGTVALQARPAAPAPEWQKQVKVDLYLPGNTTTPMYSYTVTTDQNGLFTIDDIPVGTYTIIVKGFNTLQKVKISHEIVAGGNSINFGTLIEGDLDNDNYVSTIDLGGLLSSFDKLPGDPEFIPAADLNGDGYVDTIDLAILLFNFDALGELP